MPFTISHPAAAVPLARFGLPLSALVVGSMAPDFPYFVHLSTAKQYAHTLPGLFSFCVPAGLAVLWVFHRALKLPLLSLLPLPHQARLVSAAGPFRFGPARRFCLILLALLIGAISHLVWDSFTHAHGWTVQHNPFLYQPVIRIPHGYIYVFQILQHLSSIVGAGMLAYWYSLWFKQTPAGPIDAKVDVLGRARPKLVGAMSALAVCVGALYGFVKSQWMVEGSHLPPLVFHFIVATVGAMAIELLIYSVVWHLWKRRLPGR